MNIKLITIAVLSIATLTFVRPIQAQTKPSQIAPSVSFGGTTVFGVDSRFPVTQNLSIRPNVRFPSGGVVLGTSVTYDFDNYGMDYRIEPYVGAGLNVYTGDNNNNGANVTGYAIGGADYALNDQFVLKGSVAIPFKSEYSTDITLGVGYKF